MRSRILLRSAGAAALAASIAARSGTPAVPTLVSSPASADRATRWHKATLTIHIRVPKAHHAKSGVRYISAGTRGVSLSFTGASSLQQAIAVTPGSPQ